MRCLGDKPRLRHEHMLAADTVNWLARHVDLGDECSTHILTDLTSCCRPLNTCNTQRSPTENPGWGELPFQSQIL